MRKTCKRMCLGVLVLFGFALLTASVYADAEVSTFLYTINDQAAGNTVTAFRVLPGGTLILIGTFMTGGTGSGGFFGTQPRIAATISRNFLFAGNSGSSDISVFQIDTDTGVPTLVGTPVGSGGDDSFGFSLAVTPNGKFLYVANFNSSDISAFRIGWNGTLTPIGSPLPLPTGSNPFSIKVTPDGEFVAATLPFVGVGGSVAMFRIGAGGALTSVGSFPQGGPSTETTDLDIGCKSDLLFAAHTGSGTVVSVATIADDGTLTPIGGSPFAFASGSDSDTAVVLTPDNRHLFVNNLLSNTITSLDVAQGGSLTLETPVPFANSGGDLPAGIGVNREGTLLYVANTFLNVVTGFTVDGDGGLTPVSPVNAFPTGGTELLFSLDVFPAHEVEGRGDADAQGRKGHFDFDADRKCKTRGEIEYGDDSGKEMRGHVDSYTVAGNTATMTGSGTLADGTPIQYTAIVTGNAPLIGANLFSISWITSTGSIFQTTGALTDGYIAVHP